MGVEPRRPASAKPSARDPASPDAAECPLGLGQLSGDRRVGPSGGWLASGLSLVSRLWALAVGEPDSGNPNVRFDEGTLRKQVLLYAIEAGGEQRAPTDQPNSIGSN